MAYVGDGAQSGLRVLDLSTSPRGRVWPKLRGRAELPWVSGHVVRDGLAYVPMWSRGLSIVDVSDPDAPQGLWEQDVGQAAQAVVVGDVVYVSAYDGLVVMDVSDPAAPQMLSRLSLEGPATGLAVREDVAYVAVKKAGGNKGTLCVVDVRDPQAPQLVGTVGIEGSGLRVTWADGIVYVAVLDWYSLRPRGGVQVVDVSQPAQPQTIEFLRLPSGAYDVQVLGATAYVAGGEAGVYAVDLSDPTNLRLVGHVDTAGTARRVSVVGEQLYLADGEGGLLVLQIEGAGR
jgi:hypothetical protein